MGGVGWLLSSYYGVYGLGWSGLAGWTLAGWLADWLNGWMYH